MLIIEQECATDSYLIVNQDPLVVDKMITFLYKGRYSNGSVADDYEHERYDRDLLPNPGPNDTNLMSFQTWNLLLCW
jgi:hypothetical protein